MFAPLAPAATGDRTISFYNMHTKETLTVTYMKNGRHVLEAMERINHMLRDWRRNESTRMDPELIDLVYSIHQQLGSHEPIHIVSGYRSPVTNAALRRRSKGVAKHSQHTLGKAMDLYFPDVPLKRIREVGLKHQEGGVGYYPASGRPFVHIDTGRVRHWPRMNREQLARLFPDGNTLHIPADGKPLARKVTTQNILVASSERDDPARTVVASAPSAPIISDPARDVITSRASMEIPLLGYGRAGRETIATPAKQAVALAVLPPVRPERAAARVAFIPPIPTPRPERPADAARVLAAVSGETVTASLAALPPRRPEATASLALAAAGARPAAPVPAVSWRLSGGMTYTAAELAPLASGDTVGAARFAVLTAPDQANLAPLVETPRAGLSTSFAAQPGDQPAAGSFAGPAVRRPGLATAATPFRTAAR